MAKKEEKSEWGENEDWYMEAVKRKAELIKQAEEIAGQIRIQNFVIEHQKAYFDRQTRIRRESPERPLLS